MSLQKIISNWYIYMVIQVQKNYRMPLSRTTNSQMFNTKLQAKMSDVFKLNIILKT